MPDPPVLDDRSFARTIKGRHYSLYYNGTKLHMVVLRDGQSSYWVVNSLLNALSNRTHMLAIAEGLNSLGALVVAATMARIGIFGAGWVGLVTGACLADLGHENLSIQSKTKDLDRIQSLIVLMEKTKKEKVLEAATLDRICAQIDQEILYALEAMERAREHRRQVLEKRQRSLEKKRARQDPELPFINSVLLLFRPHCPSAWLAHAVAFVSAFIVILGCVLAAARYNGEWGQWLSMAAISLVLCLLSRTWALWERKQWKTARATGIPIRTIFFRPRNVRTVLALLFAYWWLLLVVVSALACVTGAPEFYIVLVPSLLFFWLSRKWVLYERRRWDQKHPLAKPESAPRMAGMDKAEQAALPAASA